MVDFVAVIEKAVNGLSDNTPEMRQKVYDKARESINRQLDSMDPPVSDAVREKQLAKLDEAIAEVEDRNTEALPELDEEAFAEILAESEGKPAQKPPESPAPADPAPQRRSLFGRHPQPVDDDGIEASGYDQFGMDAGQPAQQEGEGYPAQDYLSDHPAGDYFEPERRGGTGRTLIFAFAFLVVLIGIGFGVYSLRDQISLLWSSTSSEPPTETVAATEEPPVEEPQADAPPADTPTEEIETAAVDDTTSGVDALQSGLSDQPKFTQRLLQDGSEVDVGPAAGSDRPAEEEGKSVASIDNTPVATAQPADVAPATDPGASADATTAEPPVIGQKMILYEELPGQQATTADDGRVVWNIVRESPGEDQPPEPAIQANIEVPSKGLSAIMTIKRNADASLPASHIIEIIFALGGEFDGNGIRSIQNFAMKQTEEDTGDRLIAVPAKITDSFLMIALNDYSEAVDLNLSLMRDRNWIDLAVAYGNGRRALLTMEKGSTGAEVFDQVIRAWEARATDTSQSQ